MGAGLTRDQESHSRAHRIEIAGKPPVEGSFAEVYYQGVPAEIETEVFSRLDGRLAGVTQDFRARYLAGGYRL